MFTPIRKLAPEEMVGRVFYPLPTLTCTNRYGGELCGMLLAETIGLDGYVCRSCNILYRLEDGWFRTGNLA